MLDMDGFEFCWCLCENLIGEFCLFVISGDSLVEMRWCVFEVGVDCFFVKIEVNEFLVKICEELFE